MIKIVLRSTVVLAAIFVVYLYIDKVLFVGNPMYYADYLEEAKLEFIEKPGSGKIYSWLIQKGDLYKDSYVPRSDWPEEIKALNPKNVIVYDKPRRLMLEKGGGLGGARGFIIAKNIQADSALANAYYLLIIDANAAVYYGKN